MKRKRKRNKLEPLLNKKNRVKDEYAIDRGHGERFHGKTRFSYREYMNEVMMEMKLVIIIKMQREN